MPCQGRKSYNRVKCRRLARRWSSVESRWSLPKCLRRFGKGEKRDSGKDARDQRPSPLNRLRPSRFFSPGVDGRTDQPAETRVSPEGLRSRSVAAFGEKDKLLFYKFSLISNFCSSLSSQKFDWSRSSNIVVSKIYSHFHGFKKLIFTIGQFWSSGPFWKRVKSLSQVKINLRRYSSVKKHTKTMNRKIEWQPSKSASRKEKML